MNFITWCNNLIFDVAIRFPVVRDKNACENRQKLQNYKINVDILHQCNKQFKLEFKHINIGYLYTNIVET